MHRTCHETCLVVAREAVQIVPVPPGLSMGWLWITRCSGLDVFAVNPDDESQVVVKPFVRKLALLALQFRKERLWFSVAMREL